MNYSERGDLERDDVLAMRLNGLRAKNAGESPRPGKTVGGRHLDDDRIAVEAGAREPGDLVLRDVRRSAAGA